MSVPTGTVQFEPPAIPKLDQLPCADVMEFFDALKKNRTIDDRIVYELNTTVPTDSFARDANISRRCENLYMQLRASYASRDSAIKRCINETQFEVDRLRKQCAESPNSSDVQKRLRKIQGNLRVLQSEVNVEEVIKDRSLKVFYERCRSAYKPPDAVIF